MRVICEDDDCGHLVEAHKDGSCTEGGCVCAGLEVCFLVLNERLDDPESADFEFRFVSAKSAIDAVRWSCVDCLKGDLLRVYDSDDEEVEILWVWQADEDDVIDEPDKPWKDWSLEERGRHDEAYRAWVERTLERDDGEQFEFRIHVHRVAHTAIRPLPADPTAAIEWQVVEPAPVRVDEADEDDDGAEQNRGVP